MVASPKPALRIRSRTETDIDPAFVAGLTADSIPHDVPQPFPGIKIDFFYVEHRPYPYGRLVRRVDTDFDAP